MSPESRPPSEAEAPTPPTRARRRLSPGRVVAVVIGAALVAAVAVSPFTDRAVPTGAYRPEVPVDAVALGCLPWPGDVRPDFRYVLRRDQELPSTDGLRREVELQVLDVDPDQAARQLSEAFADVGADDVAVTAEAFAGTGEGDVVRGRLVLDLPIPEPAPELAAGTDPGCADPYATKRFPPDLVDMS